MDNAEITKVEKFTEIQEAHEVKYILPTASAEPGRAFSLQGRPGRQFISFDGRQVYPAHGSTVVLGKLSCSPHNGAAFFELTSPNNGLQLVVLLPHAPAEPLVWAIPLPYSQDLQVFWINEQRISVGPSLLAPTFSIRLSAAVSVR